MSNPNPERDQRVDPELDALSWNPTAEEADAYLRGHGVIKKCEHCGQDATLTNDFVSHLLARFGEKMREADDATTRMRDRCVEKVRERRDKFQAAADASSLPNDLTASRDAAVAAVLTRLLGELQSLINANPAATSSPTPADRPTLNRLLSEFAHTAIKCHIGFKHEGPWDKCEWIECEDRRKMIESFAPAERTRVEGELNERETFANTHFQFGPCVHSMTKPNCAGCLQSHASRMEMQLRKLEASTALPIRERIERVLREHLGHWHEHYKGVPPTIEGWVNNALHSIMWGIDRDLPLPAAAPADNDAESLVCVCPITPSNRCRIHAALVTKGEC